MKKVIITIVLLMLIAITSIATANEDPIWMNVYDSWKVLHSDEYNKFLETEYGSEGFVKDGIAYYAGDNASLYYNEYHTVDEIKEYVNECCKKGGLTNYQYTVNVIGSDEIGRYVIETIISSTEDMTKVKGANMNFDEPVYECKLISWDRICIPTEER